MLFRNLWRATLAAAAFAPSAFADKNDNPNGQSTFISPDKSLAFALTVPENGNSDVYFSMRVSTKRSWGAIGLGSNEMAGALFLVIYRDEKGDNITFSPRLAYGNYEPAYYSDLQFEVLSGTGVTKDYMTFNARCIRHCRSWPAGTTSKGYIDVSSPNQKALYGLGPNEDFKSDEQDAGLKMHAEYGTFTIDMKRTQGPPASPVLTNNSENAGTTLDNRATGKSDWKAAVHATFMILAFIGVMPVGALLVRIEKWAQFHKFVQMGALVLVLAGLGVGIITSFNYQRSRGFHSFHQIAGFVVVFLLLCQLCLGILHHLKWKKTQQPTIFSKIHLWVGRIAMVAGAVTGYNGFAFAGDRKYIFIPVCIVFFFIFCLIAFSVWAAKGQKPPRRQQGPAGLEDVSHNYPQQQPWRNNGAQGSGSAPEYPSEPPPEYDAPSAQIGLRHMSPWKSSSPAGRDFEEEPLYPGSAQKPREFA